MKEEVALIKGRMEINERLLFGPAKGFLGAWLGHKILVVQSGVGKKQARNIFDQVLCTYSPALTISCGFAGGLNFGLKLGDILIADKVIDISFRENNENLGFNTQKIINSKEFFKAKSISDDFLFKVHSGSLVTSDIMICFPDKKKKLGDQFLALGVDMETSALLEVANKKSVPLVSIRVISDTVNQELANFSTCFDEKGNILKIKASWHVLKNPSLIPMAISLKSQMPSAVKNMTEFLEKLISSL